MPHAIARRYESRFTRSFLAGVAALRRQVTDELVAETLARGLTDQPQALLDLVDQVPVVKDAAEARAQETEIFSLLISDSAKRQARSHKLGVLEGSLLGNLNITSPTVLEAARKHSANLVTNVNSQTKNAIRHIVFESIRDGVPPVKAARRIREVVGLTKRDAIALERFRSVKGRTEKQGTTYAKKLLKRRAENIARTETVKASTTGQQNAWKEMTRNNLIDMRRFRQRWIVTSDDRLCSLCAPMEGKIVSLDMPFTSAERGILPSEREAYVGETVDGPPLHSQCRCGLVGEFGD